MRLVPICLSLACVFALPVTAFADDAARTPVALVTGQASDPCGFQRTEAYGAGLRHFSTEMLWACEAVAKRRAARIRLGEKLERFAAAMSRYEDAVNAAAHKTFTDRQKSGWYTPVPVLSDDEKLALAEQTGTLGALAEIRSGF